MSFAYWHGTYSGPLKSIRDQFKMQSNVTDLLVEAANLLLVGMSVVFIFLTLLIGAVHLIAFVNSRLPEETTEQVGQHRSRALPSAKNQAGVPHATIAAITAAIHQYRNTR